MHNYVVACNVTVEIGVIYLTVGFSQWRQGRESIVATM